MARLVQLTMDTGNGEYPFWINTDHVAHISVPVRGGVPLIGKTILRIHSEPTGYVVNGSPEDIATLCGWTPDRVELTGGN